MERGRRAIGGGRANAARPVGRSAECAHGAARRRHRRHRRTHLCLHGRQIPQRRRQASAGHPAGADRCRFVRTSCRRRARYAALARSWRVEGRARRALRLPAGGRRRPAPDSGRPGACRHHRARPFPLHRQWRARRAAGTAARLCAQGHREADGGRDARTGRQACRPHLGRLDGRLRVCLCTGRRSRAAAESAAARGILARADGGAGAPRQSFRRHRRHLQRRLVCADACANRHPARADFTRGGRLLRPPADDGLDRAGRARARYRRRRRGAGAGFVDRSRPRDSRA